MSIIIRLQNLPWSANALDIRQFFHGLSIPEGGVHIVGGELGDAFIAFSTDEDARQAFNRNDGQIKGIQIKLMLSSRQEMQRVIEQARNQSMSPFMLPGTTQAPAPLPAAVPAVVPAAVPEIKQDNRDVSDRRRDKRRSRSRSKSRDRDKKDRSRDRKDRKHRDRSRSRSRDRRDRRRRDRSRSRNRSRSRERKRERSPKRDREMDNGTQRVVPDIWSNKSANTPSPFKTVAPAEPAGFMGSFAMNMDPAKRPLNEKMGMALQPPIINGFQPPRPPFGVHNQPMNSWQNGPGFQGSNNGGPRNNFVKKNDSFGGFDNKKPFMGRKQFDDANELPTNACISMEPFYGSYGDLRRFFTRLSINYKGIKVINDEFGHKTGICFVQFRDSNAKSEALQMNGQKLNNIEVRIESITDKAFDDAIDRYHPRMENIDQDDGKFMRHKNITKYFNNAGSTETQIKEFTCLKIEDLPTYVKEQDILHIFSQHPLIALHLSPRPRGGSVAYVKFGSEEVAKQALEERPHHVIGGKPVTVKPCKDDEFERIHGEQTVGLEVKTRPALTTDCLVLSNIPPKTTDRDINDFFSDIGVVPIKTHMCHVNPTIVHCEFDNAAEATKALSKDECPLGPNTVSVSAITRSDMEQALRNASINEPDEEYEIPNIPHQFSDSESIRPNFMPKMMMQGVRPLMGERPPMRGRGGYRGGPRFPGRGRGGGPRFVHHPKEGNFDETPPGCTIFMDNVPYKAGTDEILDFFDGYTCTNNVSRRYNPNNTPSAEAKVTFRSADEAFRAVRELQGKQIWDRTIYLRQV